MAIKFDSFIGPRVFELAGREKSGCSQSIGVTHQSVAHGAQLKPRRTWPDVGRSRANNSAFGNGKVWLFY